MTDLRSQHYVFAHWLLPDLLWRGDSVLGILVNPENQSFLAEEWDRVGSGGRCRPSDGRERLACSTHWIGDDNLAVLITMPPPPEVPDAFLMAITTSPTLRYFTLERGVNDFGQPRTVLGEWTESRHANFGDGPPPDPELFLHAVCRILVLPPSIEPPTYGQSQGMSRGGSRMYSGIPMDPADAALLEERMHEAEDLEWEQREYALALARYDAALRDFFARYPSPPTEVTLLYAGAVRCLLGLGDLDSAETWARQWWTMVRRLRMLGHAEAMMASRTVAEILTKQGRQAEAEALYRHRVLLAGLARGLGSGPHQEAVKDLEGFAPP